MLSIVSLSRSGQNMERGTARVSWPPICVSSFSLVYMHSPDCHSWSPSSPSSTNLTISSPSRAALPTSSIPMTPLRLPVRQLPEVTLSPLLSSTFVPTTAAGHCQFWQAESFCKSNSLLKPVGLKENSLPPTPAASGSAIAKWAVVSSLVGRHTWSARLQHVHCKWSSFAASYLFRLAGSLFITTIKVTVCDFSVLQRDPFVWSEYESVVD